ncbi:MAG: DUF2953 domain-containing protein [Oscillospiraceae bacterium]|nr:DUF2953 domain-containing protein [Oscillospiraceae bacterium]
MIGWIIAGAILLLILALLLCHLKADLRYERETGLVIFLKFLFLRWKVYPKEKGTKTPKKGKKTPESVPGEKKKSPFKGSSLWETFDFFRTLLSSLGDPIFTLLRRMKIRKLRIYAGIRGEDAAQTAISYGQTSAALYGLLAVARNLFRLEAEQIELFPVFDEEAPLPLSVSVSFRARILHLLSFLLRFGLRFLAEMNSGQPNPAASAAGVGSKPPSKPGSAGMYKQNKNAKKEN